MFRPTTNLERNVDLLSANVSRLKSSTIGVLTKERAGLARQALDNIDEYVYRLRKDLDEVLCK